MSETRRSPETVKGPEELWLCRRTVPSFLKSLGYPSSDSDDRVECVIVSQKVMPEKRGSRGLSLPLFNLRRDLKRIALRI